MSPRPKHLSELLLRKSLVYRFTRTRSQKMKSFHVRGNEYGASVRLGNPNGRIYLMSSCNSIAPVLLGHIPH